MNLLYHAGRRYAAACFVLYLFAAPASANDALSVEAAVAQALAVYPGLQQRRELANASAAMPAQLGSLPDPWLSVEPGRADMSQLKIGISQALPYPGKLALTGEVARHEAEALRFTVGEAELDIAAQVKRAWWQVFFLDHALETLQRNQAVLRQLIQVAAVRYRVGEGLQQDVLQAQLELSKSLEEELRLDGERHAAAAKINALLYRQASTPVVLATYELEILPDVAEEQQLIEQALAARPLLLARKQRMQAAQAQVDLAHKDYRPDFMVGANYEWRETETDMKSIMFAMSLPLRSGSRQDKALDQRNAERLAQGYALQEEEAQLKAEIAALRAHYAHMRQRVVLLKTSLLPQAQQTVSAMLAGYQTGKVDYLSLSQAQITLYDSETRYWQALSDAQILLARLMATVGKEAAHE